MKTQQKQAIAKLLFEEIHDLKDCGRGYTVYGKLIKQHLEWVKLTRLR